MRNWCNWEHPCLPSRCCEFESRIPLQSGLLLVVSYVHNTNKLNRNNCNVAGCGDLSKKDVKTLVVRDDDTKLPRYEFYGFIF